jgi:surfactin synthase thioesterase subunit
VPGELHYGGTGLARGYLNRPELTAEQFFEHDFGYGPERLYATGDRARFRRDGVIELLGRMDFQVKVHGLRIELGELEAALRSHPGVDDAVVVARGERGRSTLAAFYVPTSQPASQPASEPASEPVSEPVSDAELRGWLSRTLPAYMVPAVFEPLPALPTTPNGKVDRRSLRERDIDRAGPSESPRDEVEERVAAAFRAAIAEPPATIGVDDDFFDLGGDSYAAIRAVLAVDPKLPVVELFKHPTVRGLADFLRTAGPLETRLLYRLTPADRDVRADQAELTIIGVPYGGGNAVSYQPLADLLPDGYALWAVALPGHDPSTQDEPFLDLDEAATRIADAVLAEVSGPIVVYGQCAGVALAVKLAQLLEARGADVRDVYVGAALPDPDPEASRRREAETTDDDVYGFLAGLGGFDGALEWSDVKPIIRAVRHDLMAASRFFGDSYAEPPVPLRAPLHTVFGDKDAATEQFQIRYGEWGRFATRLSVDVIEGGGHYFVRDRAADVAELLTRRVTRRAA